MTTTLVSRGAMNTRSLQRQRVYGIDFSGSVNAGNKVWVTRGVIKRPGLCVDACWRGRNLPDSGRDREHCLAALRSLIASDPRGVFGLDFPFSLPENLLGFATWEQFIHAFSDRYPCAEVFRAACLKKSGGRELKRATDRETRAPLSPYNIRLYRQTFYGLREVLAPLVQAQQAYVLPMQRPISYVAWLVEVCPASTLKRHSLYLPYKGNRFSHATAREHILAEIMQLFSIRMMTDGLRSTIIGDTNGDALDSVIAATAAFRAVMNPSCLYPTDNKLYKLEGYIYV